MYPFRSFADEADNILRQERFVHGIEIVFAAQPFFILAEFPARHDDDVNLRIEMPEFDSELDSVAIGQDEVQ